MDPLDHLFFPPKHEIVAIEELLKVPAKLGLSFDQEALEQLRRAGQSFFYLRQVVDETLRPAEVRRALEQVAKAASMFSGALEALPEELLFTLSPGWRDSIAPSASRLAETIMGIIDHREIQTARIKAIIKDVLAVGKTADRLASEFEELKAGRRRLIAEKTFVSDLARIYEAARARPAGVSFDPVRGLYSGPFYLFATKCLEVLGVERPSNLAWGQAIKRFLEA